VTSHLFRRKLRHSEHNPWVVYEEQAKEGNNILDESNICFESAKRTLA